MQFTCFVVILTFVFGIVDLSHFRGGSITWKPVNVTAVNGSTVDIIIEQSYSWRRSSQWCNDATILAQGSIGDMNFLRCATTPHCGGYINNLLTTVQCTDYSVSLDMSSGRKSSILTLNGDLQLVLQFYGAAWLTLQTGGQSWSISTIINLKSRKDNGRLNTPPISSILPVIRVPVNVQRTIVIPMADDDNDYLRCRWAQKNYSMISSPNNMTVDECGDVCSSVPNAILYGDNNGTSCHLVVNGTAIGYYLAALQIEDFYVNTTDTVPLSSVPIQFLIYVSNGNCQPTIIGVYSNGASIMIERNTNMASVTILAQIGCINTTITDFLKISPTGMKTSTIVQDPTNTSLYSIRLNWIPTSLGSQMFCCAAIDNTLAQSEMYCLTFVTVDSLNTTAITIVAQPKGPNMGLIIGLALLGLLLCCLCCWWVCFQWLCPIFRRLACCRIRQNRFKYEKKQEQQRSDVDSLYTVPTSAASSEVTVSSRTGRTSRLSNELVQLGLRYANNSLTTLKQPIKHIRNSVDHLMNAYQKNQRSSIENAMKGYVPLSSLDTIAHVNNGSSTNILTELGADDAVNFTTFSIIKANVK
ncbi:hypothetical protein I4U23_003761 [Adineta vaga]|nr:hypothetical protein I4U23_003761 [Adineta vaga]